jgi:hypothetical protein
MYENNFSLKLVKSSNLNCVDVTKLLMSFCVIGIHSYIFDRSNLSFFTEYIVSLAVPFFIVSSGYLYSKNYGLTKIYAIKIAFRYLKLYLLWVLVYLPLIIFDYIQNESNFFTISITFVRKLLLTGSNPFSYHLWYLLAVAVACLLIYLLGKAKVSMSIIWILGICLMLIGYWLENTTVTAGLIYKEIFESSNNGFTFGLAAFTTGMLLFVKKKYSMPIAIMLMVVSLFLYNIRGPFYSFFGGTSLFLFSVTIDLPESSLYKKMRSWSTWIYFIHMYFVFFIMTAIIHDWIKLNRFEGWLLVSMVSLIFAYFINKLSTARITILNNMIK